MKKFYIVMVALFLVNGATAQWEPDVRLTFDPNVSATSMNNAWCLSATGNRLHVVWQDDRDQIPGTDQNIEIYYKRSDNNGTTWGPDTRLTSNVFSSELPSVANYGSNVHVVWQDTRDMILGTDNNSEIYYKRSIDNGATWNPDVRLSGNQFSSGHPSVAASGGNPLAVHVVWQDDRDAVPNVDNNIEIYYKRSVDNGTTWGPETRLTSNTLISMNASVANAGSIVHVVWEDNRDGNLEVYYKRSVDNGLTWGPDIRLTNDASWSFAPSVAVSVDDPGTVHVAWTDSRDQTVADNNYEIYYKRSVDYGATWGNDIRITNNVFPSWMPSLAVSDQYVRVVWSDDRDGNREVYYKRSIDNGQTWGNDIRLTNNPGFSNFQSVAVSRTYAHVVWTDDRDQIPGTDFNNEIYCKRKPLGSISGIKFNDLNANGIKDPGEPGLAGWTILLNGPGIVNRPAITDAGGVYEFDGLPPGIYQVSEILKPDWMQTMPAPPGMHNIEISELYTIIWKNVNFGNCQGRISGIKFNDLNANGVRDPGEPGLAGWTIMLNGPLSQFAITDLVGTYAFVDLPPGNYQVSEILQPGWNQTMPASPGIYLLVINAPVPPAGNAIKEEIDFGNYLPPAMEFGDAPEGVIAYLPSGVVGSFPTCKSAGPAGWIQHQNSTAYLGSLADLEAEGNAGLCPTFAPNNYNQDECYADGDAGLIIPSAFTVTGLPSAIVPCPAVTGIVPLGNTCKWAQWGVNVDITVQNQMPNQAVGYVNVLMDWNHNGQWGGTSVCEGGAVVPEHVLKNFPVPNPFNGPLSSLLPPPFLLGPDSGYVWTRFSITGQPVPVPGWDGSGMFENGETEDYLLLAMPGDAIPDSLLLQNITINSATDTCFEAVNKITVGGSGTGFTVQSGGNVHLIAGQTILLLPATTVNNGGGMHAYITTDGTYCNNRRNAFVNVEEKVIAEKQAGLNIIRSGFRIYPNPTTGNLTLEPADKTAMASTVVEIYGMTGEKILRHEFAGQNKYELSLAQQPPGVYILRVITGKETGTWKVIKQ